MSIGTCEACPATDVELTKWRQFKLCPECHAKEMIAAEIRVKDANNITDLHLEYIKQENTALKIQTDIFNARIKSINELKIAIDSDESVINKNYKLAEVLNERFQHLSGILFDKRKEIIEAESEQRAIQTYYNDLNKSLRAEERAKIALKDSEYKPIIPVEKIKKITAPKKYDKTSIKVAAEKSGWDAVLIQMTCVARDITPEAAVMILNEAKNKSKGNS